MSRVRLFVGTKRGLFVFTSDATRVSWDASEPLLPGREVYFVGRTGGVVWASTNHSVWGAHLHVSHDCGQSWDVVPAAPHYADARGLQAVWSLASGNGMGELYAGIEPAGLFVSHDGGASWQGVEALNTHATAHAWQPAGGALALHSIHVYHQRIICAVSAGGVYRSDDGGASWRALNAGVRADFLPQQYPVAGQCVHRLIVHPANAERLYQQNHCGVYRSDDGGASWLDITAGLPSDYGYALAVQPDNPDVAFVIPEESSAMRTTVAGRLRVYRTTDAGRSWQALQRGLPQHNVYQSILREGLDTDSLEPCGVYFGTSGGHLFASRDSGEQWAEVASYLPRITCVRATQLD